MLPTAAMTMFRVISEADSLYSDEEELQFPFFDESGGSQGLRVGSFPSHRPSNPLASYLNAQGVNATDDPDSYDDRYGGQKKRKASLTGSFGKTSHHRRLHNSQNIPLTRTREFSLESVDFRIVTEDERLTPESDFSPSSSFGGSPQLQSGFPMRIASSSPSAVIPVEPRSATSIEDSRADAYSPLRHQLMNMQLVTR